MVLLNGFHKKDHEANSAYRYLDLGDGHKLVELFISLFGATNGKDVDAIKLPNAIKPNTLWRVSDSWGHVRVVGNTVTVTQTSTNTDANQHVAVATFIYFTD